MNDMAEVNIDIELLRGSNPSERRSDIVELTNGCICCTLRDDLLLEVASLVSKGRFDYLIIESTGKGLRLVVVKQGFDPECYSE